MKLFFSLVIIYFFSLIPFTANARLGSATDHIKYVNVNYESKYLNGKSAYRNRASDYILNVQAYFIVNTGNPLYVYATRDGYMGSLGKIVLYNHKNMSRIDDYVDILFLSVVLIGFGFAGRKKKIFFVA